MPTRQLSIAKKFSLADVGEGWQDCYVLYRPATVRDLIAFKDMNPEQMQESESIEFILKFDKEHALGGKVLVLQDDETKHVDLTKDDIEALAPSILGELFQLIIGASTDPKDTPKVQPPGNEPSIPKNTTKTS
jgi:hypothetical protein